MGWSSIYFVRPSHNPNTRLEWIPNSMVKRMHDSNAKNRNALDKLSQYTTDYIRILQWSPNFRVAATHARLDDKDD